MAATVLSGAAAHAGETLTYSYDELGRLTKVARAGTVNAGATECYNYDPASNRSNVTVSTTSDCTPPPSFSINDVSVTEGGNLVFTVTKSASPAATYTLTYTVAAGTATQTSDYDFTCQAQTGTLTFAANVFTQTVCVHTIDDALVESSETVLVNLSNPSGGATISDSQGIGTIVDNDSGGGGGGGGGHGGGCDPLCQSPAPAPDSGTTDQPTDSTTTEPPPAPPPPGGEL